MSSWDDAAATTKNVGIECEKAMNVDLFQNQTEIL